MSKVTRILISIVTIILVLALAGAAGYWSYSIKQWPWWIAVCMGLGVFALYFLILFLKKYFIRRNEKKFVQRIVDHGETLAEGARPEQLAIQELEKSWKSNMALLKSSHLRKKGNPLYVLPWYLAMGPSGVGKSTMLANAGISSSFTEIEDSQGQIEPTRNCDWAFFDSAVIFDTAGRYSVPLASNREQNEWKHFLFLLSSSRRKEPLNGIILFVAADDLMSSKAYMLTKKGQVLRNRIHSLMRTVGFKVPVSVMVTRMDTVPGFTELAELLPEEARTQVMGQLNSEATPYWKELLNLAVSGLDQGLQKIRMTLVRQPEGRDAAFFSLPSQLNRLKEGLEPFLGALFTENSYQETPVIQGIFFGSGLCTESSLPPFLQAAGDGGQKKGRNFSSVFVHDFFAKVLPLTRWNLEPVKELMVWKKVVHNLALLSLLCVAAFVAGIMGLSYFHNQEVYSLLPPEVQSSGELPGSNATLLSLEKMRLAILAVEKKNNSWKLPFVIFSNSMQAEKAYKEKYCRLFASTLLDPIEKGFEAAVNRVDHTTPLEQYADYCAYSVEQSIYLQNYLAGKTSTQFSSFSRVASSILSISNHGLISEVGSYFPALNSSYLAWSNDRTGIQERLSNLQKTLQVLLAKNRSNIDWLYTTPIADTPAVTLFDFWKYNQAEIPNSVLVPGAFTAKGRAKIEAFLSAIAKAGTTDTVIKGIHQEYLDSYTTQFVHWWKRFGDNFQGGELALQTHVDWRDTAIRMAAADNPYFQMLNTMAEELASYAKDTGNTLPGWGQSVIAINGIRKLAATTQTDPTVKPSLISRLTAEKDKVAAATLQNIDPAKATAMTEQLKLAGVWRKYEDGISGLDVITPYKEKAAAQFTAWFQKAAGSGKEQSVFETTNDAWVTLNSMGQQKYGDPFVWKIVKGPFVFLQDFAARETALVLQEKWQEDVVAGTAGVDKDKVSAVLFNKSKGLVWTYLQKYADSFVLKTVQGYTARKYYGRSLVFEPEFYSMLNLGSVLVVNEQPNYVVKIATKPMEVNSEAKTAPTYSRLNVQCAKTKYSLENDNFPRDLTVDWSKDQCGDVSLVVGFPGLELTKTWPGSYGFVHFLKQFEKGSYQFTAKDFSSDGGYLKSHGISYINLSYLFTGATNVLQLLNDSPGKLRETIILPDRQESAKSLPKLSQRIFTEFVEPAPDTNQDTKMEPAPLPVQDAPKVTSPPIAESAAADKKDVTIHDSQWLLAQDPAHFTVQIMSVQNKASLPEVFAGITGAQNNAFYTKLIRGKQWFVLLSGQFDNRLDTEKYLRSLPADIQRAGPMIRSLESIHKDLKNHPADKPAPSSPKASK